MNETLIGNQRSVKFSKPDSRADGKIQEIYSGRIGHLIKQHSAPGIQLIQKIKIPNVSRQHCVPELASRAEDQGIIQNTPLVRFTESMKAGNGAR